jgi:hypothetical protein
MRNVSAQICREYKNTFIFNIFFSLENRPVYENVGKQGRARHAPRDNIVRRIRFACWVTKAIDRNSEYVIFIALSQQQWLCERT